MVITKKVRWLVAALILILAVSMMTSCSDNGEGWNPLKRCIIGKRADDSAAKSREDEQEDDEDDSDKEVQSNLPDLQKFSAVTLDGGTFTEKDLAGYDLTMINFWATYCGPCIGEMPSLAKLADTMPENVRIITCCLDGSEEKESMAEILSDAGFTNPALLKPEGDLRVLGEELMYIPTTVLVDSSGKLIGNAKIGAPDDPEKAYTDFINQGLASLGKGPVK